MWMQQRQPRLGDILDDYCPRERRVTNHVVVAMVGPDVKHTRCSTCAAEPEYTHGRVPRVPIPPISAAPRCSRETGPAATWAADRRGAGAAAACRAMAAIGRRCRT